VYRSLAHVEIDTTGGRRLGFEHSRQYEFLRPHELVFTFDRGPAGDTPAML
jgi:hypothetical protein